MKRNWILGLFILVVVLLACAAIFKSCAAEDDLKLWIPAKLSAGPDGKGLGTGLVIQPKGSTALITFDVTWWDLEKVPAKSVSIDNPIPCRPPLSAVCPSCNAGANWIFSVGVAIPVGRR